jgi:hypothetical protein
MGAIVDRSRAGRFFNTIGVVTVMAGTALLGTGVADASSPLASTSASTELYVSEHGATGGACSKSHPCKSVDRAVVVANGVPYNDTPVTINVGKGSFVTHLNFPDKPYPEPKLTITGLSPSATTLTAGGSGSVLVAFADAPQITVERLTVSGATGTNDGGGGAVHDGGNVMSFDDVTFSHNKSSVTPDSGGAIEDDAGTMTITDSTFIDNTVGSTPYGGGAVAEQGGTLSITGSLFSGNTVESAGSGGALYVNDGHLSVANSTITANSVTGTATGGAIGLDQAPHTTVKGTTINANTASGSGGLVSGLTGSKISFGGDILIGNLGAGGSVCSGGGDSDLGYNVIDKATCSMGGKTKVESATAVGLLPLASNGGPTRTERIKKSSAAHNVVPTSFKVAGASFCAGQDQRGVPRRQGPATKCDSGGYQFAPPVIKGISPDKGTPGTAVTIDGYGLDFLSLHFGGAAPKFSVSGDVKISTAVPSIAKGEVTITLSNRDGQATTKFDVLPPPKK